MADVTMTAISRCTTGNHVTVTATVNGVSVTRRFLTADLAREPGDLEEAILNRWISAVKEAGATTIAQIQTAILNKPFKV